MRFEQHFGKIERKMIDCISISYWREASGMAAATFLSTNKTTVNLRGDQNLVVLGFSYRLVGRHRERC
jgi:hypothetical protein